MKAIDRKVLRDLRLLWSQAITIALVVGSGIGGFLASLSAWGAPGVKPGELGAFGYDPLAITSFRPEREVRAWMQRDPVNIARDILINWGVLDRARADQIEAAAKQEALEAFQWAAAQPNCKPEDGLKNVFVAGSVDARQFG